MISFLSRILPNKLLVNLYKNLPIPRRLKTWIVWRANKRFLVAVLGIILNNENKILLLKHSYRKKTPWGIPSGWLDYEDPKTGLIREIHEETNFKVEIEKLIYTEYVKIPPHRIHIFYIGRYISGEFISNEEITDYGFFDIHKLPEYVSEDLEIILDLITKETKEINA